MMKEWAVITRVLSSLTGDFIIASPHTAFSPTLLTVVTHNMQSSKLIVASTDFPF